MSKTWVVAGPGFRICYDQHPEYLRAYVFDGTDSLAISLAMWRMMDDECETTGARRLLVVEDLHSTIDEAGTHAVVEVLSELSLSALRVAFVELRDNIEGAEFGEILCMERDMKFRVFSHEADARRWLVYGD